MMGHCLQRFTLFLYDAAFICSGDNLRTSAMVGRSPHIRFMPESEPSLLMAGDCGAAGFGGARYGRGEWRGAAGAAVRGACKGFPFGGLGSFAMAMQLARGRLAK